MTQSSLAPGPFLLLSAHCYFPNTLRAVITPHDNIDLLLQYPKGTKDGSLYTIKKEIFFVSQDNFH